MAARQQVTASSDVDTVRHELEETLRAEHGLARGIVIGITIAVPLCVALWVAVIALAVAGRTGSWGGPLAMAVGLGIVTGVFFGAWAGFVAKTHTFEELDGVPTSEVTTAVTKVIADISMSLDGCVTGPDPDLKGLSDAPGF